MTEGGTVTTTKYLDGYQYENNVLKFFPHAEGYVTKEGSNTYRYVFTYSDHLGNIRLKYCDLNQNGSIESNEILEENHYYPFGLKHEGYNGDVSGLANKYKFGAKEWQDELALNLYDFEARNYDPAIVRTLTMDPLAEKFYSVSSYSFFNNNPLYFVDPTGMAADGWIKSVTDGATSYTYDADVDTVDQATAAGYKNVTDVQQGYNISATNGSYSYNLNQDGTVTNASDGSNIQFHKPITGENGFVVGGAFETGGGSKIYTSNLGEGSLFNLPKARGAISEDNSIANFFIAGAALKPIFGALFGSSAPATGRVFWSGGEVAKGAAAEFAAANGMKTLEMTTRGGIMNTVSPFLPRSVSGPIWDNLSRNFARGASGEINVFQNSAGVSLKSTWRRIEYPLLQDNNIIYHVIK